MAGEIRNGELTKKRREEGYGSGNSLHFGGVRIAE